MTSNKVKLPGALWHKRRRGLVCLIALLVSCGALPPSSPPGPVPPPLPGPLVSDNEILDGYPEHLSYSPGETAKFFVNSKKIVDNASLTLYSASKQKVVLFTVGRIGPQAMTAATPYKDGFGYRQAISLTIPKNLESGVYLLGNTIPVIVKGHHTYPLVVLDVTTLNAYNCAGGKSLYKDCSNDSFVDRARSVSFQRPLLTYKKSLTEDFLLWAASKNLKFDYVADYELEDPNILSNRTLIVLPGHSEYWSRKSRMTFDRFVEGGGNVAIFSGNTMWMQVRYEDSRIFCYKNKDEDPTPNPLLKTVSWSQPSLSYPVLDSIGAEFQYGGYMTLQHSNMGYKVRSVTNPIFSGSGVKEGETLYFNPTPQISWGGEYDGFPVETFDKDGFPSISVTSKKFYRYKLFGFDRSYLSTPSYGTFVALQKTRTSGTIINVASDVWSSALMYSSQKEKFGSITENIIELRKNPSAGSNEGVWSRD